jgi:predicted nucleic acid-binding protein
MKPFFDTSVLVSAFVEDERHHETCAEAVADAASGLVYSHALAECFAILTGGRLSVRLPPADAVRLLAANVCERMEVVGLDPQEIMRTLSHAETSGARGGAVYDCLHLAAARKAGADEILTLNVRHFVAFAPDLADRIRQP